MDEPLLRKILCEGVISLKGQFMYGSNYTFFADVTFRDETIKTVYKPRRGEMPLWDFPSKSLAGREVAAWHLSEALGWRLVPLTILREMKAFLGSGSLQLFIDHDPNLHYFTFAEETRQKLRPLALFDLIINNADRKGGHILIDSADHVWAIDHGLCFHTEDKLRTVVWDFANEDIPGALLLDLERILPRLEKDKDLQIAMAVYLSLEEIASLTVRIKSLLELKRFPEPAQDRRVFPWPPV
ncbi:MAG: SCO1664 family protein [Anaerolineaceae bacterium]|nr:SCO1664 family protein [Anaerolineaceae bacterium]